MFVMRNIIVIMIKIVIIVILIIGIEISDLLLRHCFVWQNNLSSYKSWSSYHIDTYLCICLVVDNM